MKNIRTRPASLALAGLLTLSAACGACDGASRTRFLSIGTAGTGGIYYPIGGALASRLSLSDSSRQFTAEVTGGSVENINRLRNGQMDLAFSLAITVWDAFHGVEAYPEPLPDLRILAPLYPNLTHILVTPSSGIEKGGDLRGKRIAVGPPGSGTEQIARQILEVYGLDYESVDERFLSFAEAASALKDRAIDAALISVGYPASSVLDAMTIGNVRLLPMDPAAIAEIRSRYPYYSAGTIPRGAYPGVAAPIPTLAQMNWIVAMEALDGEIVERLLEILANEREALTQVHPMAAQIDLALLEEAPIPLHAAARAWVERGGT